MSVVQLFAHQLLVMRQMMVMVIETHVLGSRSWHGRVVKDQVMALMITAVAVAATQSGSRAIVCMYGVRQ